MHGFLVGADAADLRARAGRLGEWQREQVSVDDGTNEALMRQSTYHWPHAFARLEATADELLSRYGSNHIHAVPGDLVADLRALCGLLDVDYDGFEAAA